ncbi:hypothetical protein KUCAC02_001920 [Chaenocephalus aceratus]|uniref:Uncharacterized protein n=1 Tax=Chaenocephalus aceratus TaxID=36190 RepID=A0ACB9XS12_CHAAC|nr:hypothetical protein KUCAC02_001920 [Chaenocephalus aceratus]
MEAPNFDQSRRPRLAQAKRSSPFKSAPQVAAKKKKPSESPAPKKASKAITLKLLPVSATCTAGLGDAEIRAIKIRLTATEAQLSALIQEQSSVRLALETAESQRASTRLALETLSQRLSNIERGTPPAQQEQLDTQLDTSLYQTRRRLFGYYVGEADP